MRKGFILLFLASASRLCAQPPISVPAQSPPLPIPSDEAFINQVFHTVVDSSFSHYYLDEQAHSCSFVKYDYDEWLKYDLQEDVPIYTLNELAKNAYFDRKTCTWQQDQLVNAICIGQKKIDSLLSPLVAHPRSGSIPSNLVFYFSRPVFTDDGQYAILDMAYRCDNRLCGEGSTCLFRHTSSGWKLIGRRVRWGG